MTQSFYIPGVCNMNQAEVDFRKKGGYLFGATGVLLLILLFLFSVPAIFGFTMLIPIWVAALQYIQVRHRFCVRFAAQSKFSTSKIFGMVGKASPEQRSLDNRLALRLHIQAFAVGLIGAGASVALLALLQ